MPCLAIRGKYMDILVVITVMLMITEDQTYKSRYRIITSKKNTENILCIT